MNITASENTNKNGHKEESTFSFAETIAKTPLSEMNQEESSSDDDSDEEMLPIFAGKLSQKMKNSDFVRSLQAITDEATPFDLLDSCKEQGNEHYKKAIVCLKDIICISPIYLGIVLFNAYPKKNLQTQYIYTHTSIHFSFLPLSYKINNFISSTKHLIICSITWYNVYHWYLWYNILWTS